MSERKAINKYYPPDYDPSKVVKKKKTNPNAQKVRLMVPFSMKCTLCNEYIAARRKFNARKETTQEKYMGIRIIKFHIKCPRCNAALVFRTDPKSAGFVPVDGVVRNYEPQNTAQEKEETEEDIFARLEREDQENQKFKEQQQRRKNNPFWQARPESSNTAMADLEEKLLEQQREQQMHNHLAELHAKSVRLEQSGGAEEVAALVLAKVQPQQPTQASDLAAQSAVPPKVEPPAARMPKQTHPAMVSGVITVRRPKRNDAGAPATLPQAGQSAPALAPATLLPHDPHVAPPEIPTLGLAALAGYSSDEA